MHIEARFIGGADDVLRLPQSTLPEIAFLGRSNVGKSTFINRLVNQRGLARASNTPGRTQEINIFEVKLSEQKKKPKLVLLADLPGYGFAKVSKAKRESLNQLIVSYLEYRRNFCAVCLLNDIRREPESEELFIKEQTVNSGIPLVVVLTKADKLSQNQRIKAIKGISAKYGISADECIVVGEGISTKAVWDKLLRLTRPK